MPDAGAAALVVLTGAGISADSGLATFRGGGGLWEGDRIEDVATPAAWKRDPARVWSFYQRRRAALAGVQPNAAHLALVALERRLADAGVPFTLITQNVDDLHERAGSRPLHMHGELATLRCEPCGRVVRDLEHVDPERWVACPECGFERMRPDVTWFGEIPMHLDAIAACLGSCSDFVAIGTSGVVYPAAGLLAAARVSGARTWVNSLDPPENLHPDDAFRPGRAAEIVPVLVDELRAALC